MNVKNFFVVEAIIALFFGVTLVLAPDYMGQQYLTNPAWVNAGTKFVAQGYGVLLFAIAIACWYGRNSGPSLGRKAMILIFLVFNLALIVLNSLAVLNGVETSMGWVQVLISIVLSVWSGMLFRQEQSVVA